MFPKLLGAIREFGLVAGLLYATDRFFQRLSSSLRLHAYRFMVQPITEKPLLPARFARRLEIREIRRGDPEVALMPARPEIKESRFAQDAICLGAFQNGQFMGYIWFRFGAYEEDEVRCTYLPAPEGQSIFDFDLYIFPEHRLGIAFAGIWDGANQYLRKRGVKFTFSRLTQSNYASRRAHDHLGWKEVGRAVFLQAGRLEVMAATVFPYLNLSLGKRVRLKLRADVLTRGTPTWRQR